MSNFKALDKDSRPIEFAADGDGTAEVPFVPHHKVAGTVAVSNLPATQQVSVTNFPLAQAIAGNVGLERVNRSTAFFNTTNAGTIAPAQSVAIANIGSAIETVKGTNLPAGASISWGANVNDQLDSIDYDATGTTFLITTVT